MDVSEPNKITRRTVVKVGRYFKFINQPTIRVRFSASNVYDRTVG